MHDDGEVQSPACQHRRLACSGCGGYTHAGDGGPTCAHQRPRGCDCDRFYRQWFGRELTLEAFRGMLVDDLRRARASGRKVPAEVYEAAFDHAGLLHAQAAALREVTRA
jgi:hypothetical protein